MRLHLGLIIVGMLLAILPGWAAVPVVLEPPTTTAAKAHPDDAIILWTDFEQDPAAAGWTAVETPKGAAEPAPLPLEWTMEQAHSGTRSLSATRSVLLSALMPADACFVYRLRFWGRIAPAPESKPSTRMQGKWGLRFYDNQGRVAWETIYRGAFASEEWHRYGAKIMCPFWTNRVRIAFWPEGGARIFVDDVELTEDAVANAFDKTTPPPISYRPEPDRWQYLPKTMAKLRAGEPLKVVVLGDSIANDLSNSGFHHMLERLYPGTKVELIRSVQGSVGWEHFSKDEPFKDAIEQHQPDLVIVSGMSDRDVKFLHALIAQIRAKTAAEPLVLNGQVCQTYPLSLLRPPPAGRRMPVQQRERLRAAVIEAGREGKFAVFNLGGVFDEFIYYSDIPMEWWQRDTSHLNSRGMQLIGRMLALFFDPAVQPAPETETLLLRADYETDPAQAGWSRSEEFTGGWDDTQSYTGLRSMKLALGTYTSPAFPLQPKKAYRVSFAAWARGGGQWSLIAYDKDAKVCYTRELTIPAYHSWTAYEESVTGPADVVTARLRFQPGKSECYLDDVAVQPGARQQPAVAAAGAPAPEATQKTFVEVVGTITRATKPLSYEEITPYTASLRTVEFRIDRVLSGALTAKSIIALQMAMRDKKLLPAVAYTPGMTFRLKLGLWDETDSLDTLPVADDLEMLDATWYYVITCEPARK